jgi:putrescine aminotransferase
MSARKKKQPKSSSATKRWRTLDALHHIHPFTQKELLNREGVRIITRGKGIYLWDSEGKKLLDGMAGLWCVQVGYGNRELAQAGYEALKTLLHNHFFKTTNPWTVSLRRNWRACCPKAMSACCLPIRVRKRTTPR